MEYQVDDFLNEIDEIAPPSSNVVKPSPSTNIKTTTPNAVQDQVWKQCHDELTGYAYYWNKLTDEVTWNPPVGFKSEKNAPKSLENKKKPMYIPKKDDLFPKLAKVDEFPPDSGKIYSVGGKTKVIPRQARVEKKQPVKRRHTEDESEDEKIVLISSYGTESDSEGEPPNIKKTKQEKLPSLGSDKYNSDEDDDLDILAKIQKRAQELKELGGDIPIEVKKVVESSNITNITKPTANNNNKVKSGPSLVAGYYSDSEEENDEIKNVLQTKQEPSYVSHSTLFPVPQPINVNDFIAPKPTVNNTIVNNVENFDSKLFMRKKKITVPQVTTVKKTSDEDCRKGIGFEKETSSTNNVTDNLYPGLKKGGVVFVKADVLNPVNNEDQNAKHPIEEEKLANREEIDNMHSTLKDKLTFLNEGRPPISSVQAMVIQAETLITALNDGALKGSYLKKWLEDTCSELKKLEKETAPAGWVLQWDRINRRYFYQNRLTGTSQWEYPQPDMNTCDVAMDISTTPPPPNDIELVPEELSPPLPPVIRSPTPPPPPIISGCHFVDFKNMDVPLPVQPVPNIVVNGQPHPPGMQQPPQSKDSLNSALDSFYSDIAAITSSSPPPQPVEEPPPENIAALSEIHTDGFKKKKKTKVKLSQGLAMKKKGVSQLVEKWKNVQQEYK